MLLHCALCKMLCLQLLLVEARSLLRLALLLLQQNLLQQILVGVGTKELAQQQETLTLSHSVMMAPLERLLHLGLPLPRPKTKPNV
jgi:hypothetical protein